MLAHTYRRNVGRENFVLFVKKNKNFKTALMISFTSLLIRFNELIRFRSQFFDWQAMSQCSLCVSKCIPLHQIMRLLTKMWRYTPIIKKNSGYSIFYKKKCIPLHHGQSFVKKCNGIHFIYTIIVLLELLEIVLHFLNILFSV